MIAFCLLLVGVPLIGFGPAYWAAKVFYNKDWDAWQRRIKQDADMPPSPLRMPPCLKHSRAFDVSMYFFFLFGLWLVGDAVLALMWGFMKVLSFLSSG